MMENEIQAEGDYRMDTVYNKKYRYVLLLILCLVCCRFLGCGRKPEMEHTEYISMEEHQAEEHEEDTNVAGNRLEVHFIDVGQGDCTLLLCGGHAMLIDAGEDSQGTKVQKYLLDQGVERLDYVIGTHPDADHIGGLDVILTKFDCDTIIFPEAESDTMSYKRVMETIRYKGYPVTRPELFKTYTLGEAAFTILGPVGTYEEESNNYSVALKVSFGENSFIFLGDAEEEAQLDILQSGTDVRGDVLKAGHHGSSDSASRTFAEAVDPDYVVISCGKGNDYGHPHAGTLGLFRELGVCVFRTDEQGTVTAVSDGSIITWSCEPSQTWQAGVYKEKDTLGGDLDEELLHAKYILNTNSLKFHRPECESVADMNKRNRQGCDLSREEVMELGYTPCNRCKP